MLAGVGVLVGGRGVGERRTNWRVGVLVGCLAGGRAVGAFVGCGVGGRAVGFALMEGEGLLSDGC
jgi:hypothetical protein